MSEAKGQQASHEPSMEEILASIRRIIAEDGDAAPAAPAAEERPPASRQDDILELTDVVDESGSVVSLTAPKPAPEPPVQQPEPVEPKLGLESPPPEAPPMPDEAEEQERLVSGATAAASVAALSQLASLGHREPIDNLPLGDVGRTLESLVRDVLRPLLRDWLDANLPQLVERLVHEEIQRMVREAQGR